MVARQQVQGDTSTPATLPGPCKQLSPWAEGLDPKRGRSPHPSLHHPILPPVCPVGGGDRQVGAGNRKRLTGLGWVTGWAKGQRAAREKLQRWAVSQRSFPSLPPLAPASGGRWGASQCGVGDRRWGWATGAATQGKGGRERIERAPQLPEIRAPLRPALQEGLTFQVGPPLCQPQGQGRAAPSACRQSPSLPGVWCRPVPS